MFIHLYSGLQSVSNGSAVGVSRARQWQVLHQSWTPIADARRLIAARFQQVAGSQRGGLLAALVLGSAQVQLPAELREAFRVAGLSHALAASGFHLSVVLGSVLAVGRGLSRPLRVLLGCCALIVFLTLAAVGWGVVGNDRWFARCFLVRLPSSSAIRISAVGVRVYCLSP